MRRVTLSTDWLNIVDEYQSNRDKRCHNGIDFWIAEDRDYVNSFIEKQWALPDDFSDFTGRDDVPF